MTAERVRVGICSWADAALIEDGSFYPRKSMTAAARLQWYARYFDTVEVNSGYYAIPDARNTQRWAQRTPPGFVFSVKAYSLLTGHHPRAESLPADVQALLPARPARTHRGEIDRASIPPEAIDATFALFRAALVPLAEAGKLGYVLFQFAPWVHFDDTWLAYVAGLPARLPGWMVAAEFRHRSWFPDHAAETLTALRDSGVAHVVVDGPVPAGSVPRVTTATARTAVLRLHGRNAAGWSKQLRGEEPAVREKYDYLYTDAELGELKPEIDMLAGETEQVFVSFNNNNRAYPVQNALMMKRLLGQRAETPPAMAPRVSGDLFA
ncbi:MAG: DUF72 domain-containing protein [Candidatus Rokubacteria bacterium]|nr:DUF72 domain-containing protein [Candidatus Rokubacteria bacterium]